MVSAGVLVYYKAVTSNKKQRSTIDENKLDRVNSVDSEAELYSCNNAPGRLYARPNYNSLWDKLLCVWLAMMQGQCVLVIQKFKFEKKINNNFALVLVLL